MPVDYSDEVSFEQVKLIQKLVEEEFNSGDWIVAESETP